MYKTNPFLFKKDSTFQLKTKDFKDLLKSLPPGKADLVLTDPPYSISKKTGFKQLGKNSIERFAVSMDFGQWDKKEIDLKAFASLSFKALRRGGTIICFYDLWKITKVQEAFISAGFGMIRLIIWEKTNPVPLNSHSIYLSNSREVAVLGVKHGKPTFNSKYDNGIYSFPIPRKRIHPTQKPLQLMEALIKKHSQTKDLVIDPFVGSGTTVLAALKLKRRVIGGDKDSSYIKKARTRIETESHKKIFIPRASTARQNRSIKACLS